MQTTRRATILGFGGAAALAGCATPSADAGGLTTPQFGDWLERYRAAWEGRAASAAGMLFTEDATYHEMPFDAPMQGRAAIEAYWTRVTEPQSDIRFSHEVIACAGDLGIAHWHAVFNAGGAQVELDGVFICAFAEDRTRARALREWWHARSTPAAE